MSYTYSEKSPNKDNSNDLKGSIRTASDVRIITNEDILRSTRRIDRFLSFLNEKEDLLVESKSTARVQVSYDVWTQEKMVDLLFQSLAQVNIEIEYNREILVIPKYSERVINQAPKLAVYKPTPELTIDLSDLNQELVFRLYKLKNKERSEILQRAGKKLFKTFFPHYYNFVADLVKIRINE